MEQGRLIGQKRRLQPKQVWSISARLELADNLRDLALFNLAIDSKLKGCDIERPRTGAKTAEGKARQAKGYRRCRNGGR